MFHHPAEFETKTENKQLLKTQFGLLETRQMKKLKSPNENQVGNNQKNRMNTEGLLFLFKSS